MGPNWITLPPGREARDDRRRRWRGGDRGTRTGYGGMTRTRISAAQRGATTRVSRAPRIRLSRP